MKLEDVTTFLKVAELHSFNRAATALLISKSVVSSRVSRLENDLKARLIARTTRGVSLTEAGEVFREHCLGAIAELEAAQDALRKPKDGLAGLFRFTAPFDFGVKCVAGALPKFLELHPDLRCEAEYFDALPDLSTGRFDLMLQLVRPVDCSSNLEIVAKINCLIVGSPDLISRVGAPAHPNDLCTKPCASYKGVVDLSAWHFVSGNRTIAIPINCALRANNMEALRIAAEAGAGFTLLPLFSVIDSLQRGSLVRVLPDYPLADYLICAYYPPGVKVSRTARQFVDFLTTHLSAPTMFEQLERLPFSDQIGQSGCGCSSASGENAPGRPAVGSQKKLIRVASRKSPNTPSSSGIGAPLLCDG